jgi:hypothetical protein
MGQARVFQFGCMDAQGGGGVTAVLWYGPAEQLQHVRAIIGHWTQHIKTRGGSKASRTSRPIAQSLCSEPAVPSPAHPPTHPNTAHVQKSMHTHS